MTFIRCDKEVKVTLHEDITQLLCTMMAAYKPTVDHITMLWNANLSKIIQINTHFVLLARFSSLQLKFTALRQLKIRKSAGIHTMKACDVIRAWKFDFVSIFFISLELASKAILKLCPISGIILAKSILLIVLYEMLLQKIL